MRTREMIIEGRDRIISLRRAGKPDIALVASLCAIGEDYASMYPACFTAHEEGEPHTLRPEVAAEALDILREGLRNAFVHAAAANIELAVAWQVDAFCLRLTDDGCGSDEAILQTGGREGHWGLPGMRERSARIGAQLVLHRRESGGTELLLRLSARSAFADYRGRLRERLWPTREAHAD
jgi:nitrate/nitrite-specific signal transduction histidine kinase